MTSIAYIARRKLVATDREDTEQTFVIARLTEFTVPDPQFNRSYAASMDGRSGKGTLVASHEVARIGFTVPYNQMVYVREMVYSMADYQQCVVDVSDVDFVEGDSRTIIYMGNTFPMDLKGCTHVSGAIDVRFLD